MPRTRAPRLITTEDGPRQRPRRPRQLRHILLPGSRGAFAKAVEDALPAVRRFVRSSGQDAAVAAGEALAALGRAIETLPDPAGAARADIKEINFEAERLRRSEKLSFGVAKWIKLGLGAAVDALDKLSPPGPAKSFWIRAARESQDAIDASTTATFQRAALQDALRSTVTAFVIVGQGLEVCR